MFCQRQIFHPFVFFQKKKSRSALHGKSQHKAQFWSAAFLNAPYGNCTIQDTSRGAISAQAHEAHAKLKSVPALKIKFTLLDLMILTSNFVRVGIRSQWDLFDSVVRVSDMCAVLGALFEINVADLTRC